MVYFLTTRMLRDQGRRRTLLISPLLPLRNQSFIRVRELFKKSSDLTLNIKEMGDFFIIGVAATPTKTPA